MPENLNLGGPVEDDEPIEPFPGPDVEDGKKKGDEDDEVQDEPGSFPGPDVEDNKS